MNVHGSLKKRIAPMPPGCSMYGTLPSNHSRTTSDPMASGYHTLSYHTHKRSPSGDSTSGRSAFQTFGNTFYDSTIKHLIIFFF